MKYLYLFCLLLFAALACDKEEAGQTPTPVRPTPPASTTVSTSTAVSGTPISGTPATTTTISSTGVSSTAISTTGVSTTLVSTTTVASTPGSTTTTPPTPVTPPAPTPASPVTLTYTDGRGNPYLLLGSLSKATSDPQNTSDFLLIKDQYIVSYDRAKGHPNWVAWHLQRSDLGSADRQNDFRPDNTLPAGWYPVRPTDYTNVDGFDRGHLCPSADRTDTQANNSATFLMTNIIPQAPSLNRGYWAKLEAHCRELVLAGNELYIYSGAYGSGGTGSAGAKTTLASGKVNVPAWIWKVILVLPQGDNDLARITDRTTVIAVNVPNQELTEDKEWNDFLVSPASIETKSGVSFFSALPLGVSASLRYTTYRVTPPAPTPPSTPTPPTPTNPSTPSNPPTPTTPSTPAPPTPTGDSPCGFYNAKQLYKGPQGGCYYINSNGNKTYVDRANCKC